MDALNLCFTLLLPLTACSQDLGGETVVKTIGKQPDVTQICTNETQNIITLIVCTIRTQRSGGENCQLLYEHARGFEHKCDSRFTLMKENQTVFLHLINLTSEDSGSYSCECSAPERTNILHLNVTVEGRQELSSRSGTETVPLTLICVTVFIIVSLVIFGFIHARLRQRKPSPRPQNTGSEDIEPYSTYIRRESGLYSTVQMHHSKQNTNSSHVSADTIETVYAGVQ
ncbi:mitochondrial dynamics protein MID51/49 [Sarotherodon galilaeus]